MGTKIQANSFLREYHHSVIDLDGSTINGMRSLYQQNEAAKNGMNPDSKVRQTILEHESIFRNQLQELHRLYRRQRELMSEMKKSEINKDGVKEGKSQSSYLLCPSFLNVDKQMQERFSKLAGIDCSLGDRKHHASYDRDTKLSLSAAQTCQREADALTLNLYFNRTNNQGNLSVTNPIDGTPDSATLSREASAYSCVNFNCATKDFFQNRMDGMNGASYRGILGLRDGKGHLSDEHADKRSRFDKHSSIGDLSAGKSLAFPQSLLAEPRKEFSSCPLDMGASVSRKKKKIFGVEIYEGNDDPFNAASNTLSTLDSKVGSHQENHRVVSFVQNLKLSGTNVNDVKNERPKIDLNGEISNQTWHSDLKGKWLQGCSSVGVNFATCQFTESDPKKSFKNSEDMNSKSAEVYSENSKNFQENTKGGLPWFLRNSQVSDDMDEGKKSSYFMNLDSLQNRSQEFFGKAEIADKEISAPMAAKDAENDTKEIRNDSSRKVEKDEEVGKNELENKDLVLHKGLNNYIADLRHHIDLNFSLDEEDAPSLPTAIVKIATTEIDLEGPAVVESESFASPEEVNTGKTVVSPGNCEVSYEETDKIAAEAIIAISLCTEKNSVNDGLKWFAEIISSQYADEEESVPNGMDYFEFMTLKLKDTKEEHYHYKPVILNNQGDDETRVTLSKRSRRGRQRKDFQRDILPGLVTLSRLEITEDFQAFEELLKAEGGNWQLGFSQRSSVRNGRGRKRLGGQSTSPKAKALCLTLAKQPVCQLEERSLTGWGKRTRRLPRQRCPNAILSFPVKC